MATHLPPGICRAFVTFSSLRASSPLGGVARSHAKGDPTARGGERKLSLSSALEASPLAPALPRVLASLAIIEGLARRVFFLRKTAMPFVGAGRFKDRPIPGQHPSSCPPYISIVCLLISWEGAHDTLFTRSRVKKRESF